MNMSRLYIFFSNFFKYKKFYLESYIFRDYYNESKRNTLKEIPIGAKVAIYAFGTFGESLFVDLFSVYRITGIFDLNYQKFDSNVIAPNKINGHDFDYIIISVKNKKAIESIKEQIISFGVNIDQIVIP